MKKYAMPIIMLAVFETVAITLWLTKNNLFYGVRKELSQRRIMTTSSLYI